MKTKLVLGLCVASSVVAFSSSAWALFAKGPETYKILNAKGQTPTFRVLSDTPTKQLLAMAAIGMINAQKEVQPKLPQTSYVDLKFQTLKLTPTGDQLELQLKLSGYPVDLDQKISKADFLKGTPVTVTYPKSTKELAMYSVTSNGRLKLHLEKEVIIFENVEAHMTIEPPMGDTESEKIQFTGTGRHI